MIRRMVIIIVIFSALVFFSILVFKFLTTSTLTITLKPLTSPLSTSVKVDGVTLTPSGQGGQQYIVKVGMGSHKIEVSSSGFSDDQSEISTGLRESQDIQITLQEVTAEEVAQTTVSNIEGISVFNPRFFGNKDWMVFFARSEEGSAEGSLIVTRFDANEAKWVIVEEGTDFAIDSSTFNDAPSDLLTYLRSSRE